MWGDPEVRSRECVSAVLRIARRIVHTHLDCTCEDQDPAETKPNLTHNILLNTHSIFIPHHSHCLNSESVEIGKSASNRCK